MRNSVSENKTQGQVIPDPNIGTVVNYAYHRLTGFHRGEIRQQSVVGVQKRLATYDTFIRKMLHSH